MVCLCCIDPIAVHYAFLVLMTGILFYFSSKSSKGAAIVFCIVGLLCSTDVGDKLGEYAFSRFMGAITKSEAIDKYRCGLFKEVKGRVLELGPGPGTNMRCLKENNHRIKEWVGIEPVNKFEDLLSEAKSNNNITFPTSMRWLKGEDLDVEAESFDYVIASHLLCSVDDIPQVLKQAKRALKKGGKYLGLEHVLTDLSFDARGIEGNNGMTLQDRQELKWWQEVLAPVFWVLGRGCKFLDIGKEVIDMEGMNTDVTYVHTPHSIPIYRPHVIIKGKKL